MAVHLELPQLNETMLEAIVVRWLKQEGDMVARGEPLIEVETDKAISEVTAAASGRLLKVLVQPDSTIRVGEPFAIVGEDGESVDESPQGPASASSKVEQPAAEEKSAPRPSGRKIQATPAARRIAAERGISLEGIVGSGPSGMIVERDLEQLSGVSSQPADLDDDVETVLLTGARKIVAERMLESSKTTAQVTTFIDVDMTRVGQLRRELGATYTAFVVKAVAQTLPEFPYLNSSMEGEKVLLRKRIHIGVAVAAGDALVVAVLRDANRKSFKQIVEELNTLSEKGRERRLTADEMQGATFTISNPGVFGAVFSTPIINLPQAAILGTGRVRKVPVVRGDEIGIGEVMFLSLSYDHRLVDGAPAARFIKALKDLLENPDKLLD